MQVNSNPTRSSFNEPIEVFVEKHFYSMSYRSMKEALREVTNQYNELSAVIRTLQEYQIDIPEIEMRYNLFEALKRKIEKRIDELSNIHQ